MSDIEKRLARLERENRWAKRAAAGAVVMAGLLAFVAANNGNDAPDLVARSLTLVDSQGKPLAIFNGDDTRGASLSIFGAVAETVDVSLSRGGIKSHQYTVPGTDKGNRSVWIDKNGIKSPLFSVSALGGEPVGTFGLVAEALGGGAWLMIMDEGGGNKVRITRKGFTGEVLGKPTEDKNNSGRIDSP